MSLYGEMPLKQLYVRSFDFTHYVLNGYIRPTVYVRGSRAVQKSSMTGSMVLAKEEVANALCGSLSAVLNEVVTTGYSVPKKYRETQQPVQKQTSLRKNFNETAFFFPALQTDNKGNVSLKFTLPESVTTWRLLGLAHDLSLIHI